MKRKKASRQVNRLLHAHKPKQRLWAKLGTIDLRGAFSCPGEGKPHGEDQTVCPRCCPSDPEANTRRM